MKHGFKVSLTVEALDKILRDRPEFIIPSGEPVAMWIDQERQIVEIKYQSQDGPKINECGEYPCRPVGLITLGDLDVKCV